jgi:hypothetical protein
VTRRKIRRVAAAVLFAGSLVAIWAFSRPGPPNDFAERPTTWSGDVRVQTGPGWTVEASRELDLPCWQIRLGSNASKCWGRPESAGMSFFELRGSGHHFVVVLYNSPAPASAQLFSTSSDSSSETMEKAWDNIYLRAFELQPGEEAWGYHILDSTGAVVQNESLLP